MNKVFISYVRKNRKKVDKLCQELEQYGIQTWLDRNDIKPGARWKVEIRRAIRDGAFFIACFSKEYNRRDKTYMNEEIKVAIEELRQFNPERIWFVPVKLNECEIPDFAIGPNETLRDDIEFVALYENWTDGIRRILEVIPPGLSDSVIGDEIRRDDFVAYNNRGLDYFRRGECDRAIELLSTAIQLKPDYVLAYNNLGHVYQRIGEYDRAIANFTKALELKPGDANTALYLRNVSSLKEAGLYPEDMGNPRSV